jgi:hypothetical protein
MEKLTGEKPDAKSWPELLRSVVHIPDKGAPSAYCVATVRVTEACADELGKIGSTKSAMMPMKTIQCRAP